MQAIDFRSDTVTQPTAAMRRAMAEAEVGDDVYDEDPTVHRLQAKAAQLVGMQAALFVPTGTMGNQIATWVHTKRNAAVLCADTCHINLYEGGAASLLSGAAIKTVASPTGVFLPAEMERHFLPRDPHFSAIGMVAIENTHNYSGGRTWSAAQVQAIAQATHAKGARLHIDGARIFNAAVARGTNAAALCEGADSVMFCLSKGLSAPVGSMLCGTADFVAQARFVRKVLGGGMRQAGHLAAAGLVALETGIDRLVEDHANARHLAEGLAQLPGVRVALDEVETNMVMADIAGTGMGSAQFIAKARTVGVLGNNRDAGPTVRFVTHRNVTRQQCTEAVERLRKMLRSNS